MASAGFPTRTGPAPPLVYDNLGSGHRANYIQLFAALVRGEGRIGTYWQNLARLVFCRSLMIPTFEGAPRRNLAIILARVVLRRRTVVLFLRAHLVEHRHHIARLMHSTALRIMGTNRRVLPLSIVGSEYLKRCCPRVEVIVDPEFWDFEFTSRAEPDERLIREVRVRAGGRKILLIAGAIAEDKAVAELGRIYAYNPALRDVLYPVLAGAVFPTAAADCSFIDEHGWHLDGWIDDRRFQSLFQAADFAWCAYRPSRDMSSGILGRCIQWSVIPIVRQSSVAETLARRWTDVIAIDFSNPEASAKALLSFSHVRAPVRHDELRAEGERVQRLLCQFLSHKGSF